MTTGYIFLPVEGGGGGSGNIVSINGSTAANQFIVGGTNIAVVSGGGTATINLSGPIPISLGGTGQSNQQAALNNLTDIGSHSNGDVLQLIAGNALFASASGLVTYAAINAALGLPTNAFMFSDATSQVVGYSNWAIDPVTKFSSVGTTYQPNNLAAGPFAFGWNINIDPLQNSPNDSIRLQSFSLNLDSSATGFSFGTAGQAAELIGGGYNYGGNGASFGVIRNINLFTGLGNGTDPGTFQQIVASAHAYNISANITLDGQITGYDFNVNINAAAITTSNFNVIWQSDFSQLPVDVYGYQGVVCQPTIATIKNNSNFHGVFVGCNISLMEGDAGCYAFSAGGSIGTLGTSGYQGLGISTNITTVPATANVSGIGVFNQITTMAAGSGFHGMNISPTFTTMHGTYDGYQTYPAITTGDSTVVLYSGGMNSVHTTANTAVLNLNGLTADGNDSAFSADGVSMNISGTMTPLSGQTTQVKHVLFTQFTVPDNTAVTGTDCLINVLTPGINFGNAGSSLAVGPSGLGSAFVAFAAQMQGHGQCDLMSAVIPGAIFLDDFNLTEWRNVNAIQINAGFTGTVTNATAFYHEITGAGLFATNHWGFQVVSDIDNYLTKLAVNTASKKVTNSSVAIEIGGSDRAFRNANMTTLQRLALTALPGMQVYDTDLNQMAYYNGTTWVIY